MTRPVRVAASVEIDVGEWSIPPLDVVQEGSEAVMLALRGGRAVAGRALLRSDAIFPSIIDVQPGASVLLRDTTVVATGPDGAGDAHAVVRQDLSTATGAVEIRGVSTEGALDHILLLQTSLEEGDAGCVARGHAVIGAEAGAHSSVDLAEGGVLVGALCVAGGTPSLDFTSVDGADLKVDRLLLRGSAVGRPLTTGGEDLWLPPLSTPAQVRIVESLWTGLTLGSTPLLGNAERVELRSFVAAKVNLHGSGVVAAREVVVDQALWCDVTGAGSVLGLPAEADIAARLGRSGFLRVEVPLVRGPDSATVSFTNLTVTRSTSGALVDGGIRPALRNLYLDGPWTLPTLRDEDGDVVQAVRLHGSECPEGAADCAVAENSWIEPSLFDCDAVAEAFFLQEQSLSSWPRALPELDRLVVPRADPLAFEGVSTDETAEWGCGGEVPPRVGAWPDGACGLDLFDPYGAQGAPDDTGAPGMADSGFGDGGGAPEGGASMVYGCQGRGLAAGTVWMVALIRMRRRRQARPPSGREHSG